MIRLWIFTLASLIALSASNSFAQDNTTYQSEKADQPENAYRPLAFGFDFLPFLGTSSGSPNRRRIISINLGGGLSGGIDSQEVAAGFNIATGDVRGAQFAGGFNIVSADVDAAQLAGGFNVVSGSVDGLQGAGGFNVVGGGVNGVQASGGFNIASAAVSGVQVAGGFNIAGGDVAGVQIAPINFAGGHVDGTQIGVINLAKSADAGVALIGIYWDGFTQVEAFGSDDGLMMAGIRHGSGSFYNVYFAGTRPFAEHTAPLAYGLGFGWRTKFGNRAEFSLDVIGTGVTGGGEDWTWSDQYNLFKLRPMLSVDIIEGVALFGGPTATLLLGNQDSNTSVDDLALFGGWELTDEGAAATVSIWPGLTLGARFF